MLPQWNNFLTALEQLGGTGTMDEVAAIVRKGAGSLGSRTKSMEERGYLVWDREAGTITITQKGRDRFADPDAILAKPVVADAFSGKEQKRLRELGGRKRLFKQTVQNLASSAKRRIDAEIERIDKSLERRPESSGGWLTEGTTPPPPKARR